MSNVSVVIPLYNKEDTIRDTILSVLRQEYCDFEIVVIDDGSTDNGAAIVRQISDPRIRLLSKANGGVSSARNAGIAAAKTDYIAFLDADDFWSPSYLEQMMSLVTEFPDCAMWFCSRAIKTETKTITNQNFYFPTGYKGRISIFDFKEFYGPWTSATIVRKFLDNKIVQFDENFSKGEDIDLWISLAIQSNTAFLNLPLATYNLCAQNRAMSIRHPESMSMIGNINRYRQIALSDKRIKQYLDRLCLDHAKMSLIGASLEVTSPIPLLKQIPWTLSSVMWKISQYVPAVARRSYAKTCMRVEKLHTRFLLLYWKAFHQFKALI